MTNLKKSKQILPFLRTKVLGIILASLINCVNFIKYFIIELTVVVTKYALHLYNIKRSTCTQVFKNYFSKVYGHIFGQKCH